MNTRNEVTVLVTTDASDSDCHDAWLSQTAIHGAGHFLLEAMQTGHLPYYTAIMPEDGCGCCIPLIGNDNICHYLLTSMAGYVVEAYLKNGRIVEDELAPYISVFRYDYDNLLTELKSRCGGRVTEDMLRLVLAGFNVAQACNYNVAAVSKLNAAPETAGGCYAISL